MVAEEYFHLQMSNEKKLTGDSMSCVVMAHAEKSIRQRKSNYSNTNNSTLVSFPEMLIQQGIRAKINTSSICFIYFRSGLLFFRTRKKITRLRFAIRTNQANLFVPILKEKRYTSHHTQLNQLL